MEHIRHQLTTWYENRQNMGMVWNSIVVPSAEAKILEAVADARCYQVLCANEVEFEVVSTERTNIVDIRSRVCSCRRWKIYGLPCAHAAAALMPSGKNAHVLADYCFKVESYRETYSQMIYPIPDKSLWKDVNEGAKGEMVIWPPKTRRPPGRPKKKVLRIESLKRPKRIVQCGHCHMLGHSQKKVYNADLSVTATLSVFLIYISLLFVFSFFDSWHRVVYFVCLSSLKNNLFLSFIFYFVCYYGLLLFEMTCFLG
ncbi:putative Zinc finger, SWIM-type [Helianthus annuus]|uniref:Zinc finger, SWIM-type n=1 Tax=Helianthus annuus TaxID=4232 RepID=A0A9K3E5S6_HELAN|nr:putative Zinc finger, SWIM-type [Helianthus annuus]KAJ0838865.1 putative Zinc finger, SWIM-type [Helianthus annuus]